MVVSVRTIALAILSLLLSGVLPAAAQDGEDRLPGLGMRLLEVPATSADDPRANIYITDHVEPGTTIERRIAVSNGTDESLPVELYGTAATVEDGWVVQDGEAGNELAEWISVDPDELVLDAGEVREVTARIEVPPDATGGERYAAVLAATRADEEGDGVQIISRVGIRVYLSVGGPVAPTEDFEIDTLTGGRDDDGTPYVLIGVSNTGERAIDAAGDLSLADGPGDLSAGPFPVSLPQTIGPGDSGELLVPLDPALPDGPWLAVANLRSGLLERQAEATITFPEAGTQAAAVTVDQDSAAGLPPWAIGGLVLGALGLLLLLLLLLLWRRRRREEPDEEANEEADAADDEDVADDLAAPAPQMAPPPATPPPATPPPMAPPTAPDSPQVPAAPRGGPRSAPVAPPAPLPDR
ncbi:hypothetical protein BH23ACT9_BH23ACT9_05890 [soil metagenome]